MSAWKFYKEFGRYVFDWPLLLVEGVSLTAYLFGPKLEQYEGTVVTELIKEYALWVMWFAILIGLITAPFRHYRKITIEKSEDYLKHNKEARKDRACREFYKLFKDSEMESRSSPERREKWELRVERAIVDYLGDRVLDQYLINKGMKAGPTEEDTKLAQNEYVREFVNGQLKDDFYMTI